ncbi:Asp-tRNA(Asn)/Glu-tRNA(Gln) amidotransferase subunit GatA [Herbivorax sp. ANBcel31]|uniref:Asp-tRNA(Asn)/Glu-tRNA(Gln) amidotransferase subunit GatA n=1 Tax=Herbivorax sp. ANBcel31 TaxID=3069754 RepID=UPI0027B3DB3D|nr:Asp-tRNA(Asn)/Glu-tRNA(Gln) amidotransferase subunit GatA [Herbivorax sp. ANBcel31]MDQ2085948.1 Asp-tRNA(Asn)/Glu-tRNA(Gln) amidotransferase subunit GatA [Herbivorax sp. ANBcel31]
MDLHELTVHQMSNLIKNRKLGVRELTKATIDRIKKVDKEIGSYITIVEEKAIKRAEIIQEKIDKKIAKFPLSGIPMALKDNICTEGIKTTCASKMLDNFVPPYNATVYNKLFLEDTVLMGKLNMDEFAMGSSTENSFYKPCKNPWNLEKVAGGSSGGSAASVSAGLAAFSLGTDTGGSVRQPASLCGVVGMKPTYGLVSRYGLVALAPSLDQIGSITKDVTDCALVLNAIQGHDERDSTSLNIGYTDYTRALINDIKGMVVGIPKEYISGRVNPEVKKAVLDAAKVLTELGAECEEFSLPITEYAILAYYIISSAEASSNLARYDGIKYGHRAKEYKDLSDLYRKSRSEGFGREVKRRIMLGTYALSSGYYDRYYKKALKVRTLVKDNFTKAFDKYDVIIGPTSPTTANKIGEQKDLLKMYSGDVYTAAANIAGLPGLSIPCGTDKDNLPIGLQLIGKPLAESTLLRVAYTFEQNTDFHKNRARI